MAQALGAFTGDAAGFDEALKTIDLLVDWDANVDMKDNRGQTALMTAAQMNHPEVVKRLLNAGARADLRNKEGRTAVDLARAAGSPAALRVLGEAK